MPSLYDHPPSEIIKKTAEELKKELPLPTWTAYVKTGHSHERPPEQPDWYYYRAASVLRKVYKYGPLGVNKLRVAYGSKKNRGHAPSHFYPAGGKIIRTILQQLEKQGYIKKDVKARHHGRSITPKGRSFLDKIIHYGPSRTSTENSGRDAEQGQKTSRTPKAS